MRGHLCGLSGYFSSSHTPLARTWSCSWPSCKDNRNTVGYGLGLAMLLTVKEGRGMALDDQVQVQLLDETQSNYSFNRIEICFPLQPQLSRVIQSGTGSHTACPGSAVSLSSGLLATHVGGISVHPWGGRHLAFVSLPTHLLEPVLLLTSHWPVHNLTMSCCKGG